MIPGLTVAFFAAAVLLQFYIAFRSLDGWTLALRRERVLVELINAIGTENEQLMIDAQLAIVAELNAQADYARTRWWWQRAPRAGRPWPAN